MPGVYVDDCDQKWKTSILIPATEHTLQLPAARDLRLDNVAEWFADMFLPTLNADSLHEQDKPKSRRLEPYLQASPIDVDIAKCVLEYAKQQDVFVRSEAVYKELFQSLDVESRWSASTQGMSAIALVLANDGKFATVCFKTSGVAVFPFWSSLFSFGCSSSKPIFLCKTLWQDCRTSTGSSWKGYGVYPSEVCPQCK